MKFELNTDRLTLKVLNKDAAKLALAFYQKNSDIFEKYEPLLGDDFYTLEHQQKLLEFEYKNILNLSMIRYWIFEKDDPSQIIGTVSLRNIIRPIYASCTIGYKMDRDHMNMGYCSEAISAIIPHAIEELGMHRIEAIVMPDNAPSIHLLEKLGFEREGLLRDKIMLQGKRKDHFMYAYLADN